MTKPKLRPTDLRLYRLTPKDKDGIYGRLHVPEERLDSQRVVHKFDTLERPYKGNAKFTSSIPLGVYRLRKKVGGYFYDAYMERWRHPYVIEVAGVKGRTEILFHTGNDIGDSQGCILIGQRLRRAGPKMIENSRPRYKLFWQLVDKLFKEVETRYDKNERNIIIEICESKEEG